ncbi:hypothetical protein SAMN02745857_00685 [Andreprevotia lacus DSM 23236]|uniref:SMI1 / KNR4 family (SUKH-1) n=1 Tax=Andreprevotia lacus DSM 23236 TaxID=1121001 RepID=A0A1W1X652_9NEIS|nr:SMI1/KNR4 family protein [Andreprevotia lacus]SMC19283.1 hypothetical protein SAMN02745857_00685 [Andreprevotia lacus DSM 23236]
MSQFAELHALFRRENQRMICGRGHEPGQLIAGVSHRVLQRLTGEELARLQRDYPEQPALHDFYAEFGSLELYVAETLCVSSDEYPTAFLLAAPEEWDDLKDSVQDWLEWLEGDELDEVMPFALDDSIVFGRVPRAATYFMLVVRGEHAGKVYEFDHDGYEVDCVGASLPAFIAWLAIPDEALCRYIRAHTRYSDGVTEKEWLAERYESD